MTLAEEFDRLADRAPDLEITLTVLGTREALRLIGGHTNDRRKFRVLATDAITAVAIPNPTPAANDGAEQAWIRAVWNESQDLHENVRHHQAPGVRTEKTETKALRSARISDAARASARALRRLERMADKDTTRDHGTDPFAKPTVDREAFDYLLRKANPDVGFDRVPTHQEVAKAIKCSQESLSNAKSYLGLRKRLIHLLEGAPKRG